MKLAFIVQRYGRDILGGAETLARQIAERLARRHDIEVLTTTARDYITWRNEYPAGEEKLRGVRIKRFAVEAERNLNEFNRYSDWIYNNPHTRDDELRWLDMQGPVVPELIEHLRREHTRYELLVFFTYLYYPTFYGLQVDPERSALVPTAHDEPPMALGIYKEMFELPSSFIFNTEAEELLALDRFGVYKKMRETIGIGMELLDVPDVTGFKRKHKLPGRYLLYAGRIDQGKGCDELLRFFRFYKEERPEAANLQLILIGNLSMKLPQAKDIRYLGFLGEDEKLAAMAAATAVVVPSRLESLSIVALEAFSVGTPVLVNGGSKVLVDHCRKANAGLFYADYDEFEEVLDLLLKEKALLRGMGRLGQRYIKENFGWEKLLAKYELALRSSARCRRPGIRPKEERAEEEREGKAEEAPRVEPRAAAEAAEEDKPPSEASPAVAESAEADASPEDTKPRDEVASTIVREPPEDVARQTDERADEEPVPLTEELRPREDKPEAESKDVEPAELVLPFKTEQGEAPPSSEEPHEAEEPPSKETDETEAVSAAKEEPAEPMERQEAEIDSTPDTEDTTSLTSLDAREKKGDE